MERKFSHLKAQRLESARWVKLEYDRLHAMPADMNSGSLQCG
ncbi:hypothetical protein PC114_g10654 [Phytophthora cactorum]|nr:hypothetical protein PC114_g10654 [Phytophthora cactorum]KAG3169821.1 hypothetical protein C6341_g10989 [Phytophthora cactorum]